MVGKSHTAISVRFGGMWIEVNPAVRKTSIGILSRVLSRSVAAGHISWNYGITDIVLMP